MAKVTDENGNEREPTEEEKRKHEEKETEKEAERAAEEARHPLDTEGKINCVKDVLDFIRNQFLEVSKKKSCGVWFYFTPGVLGTIHCRVQEGVL